MKQLSEATQDRIREELGDEEAKRFLGQANETRVGAFMRFAMDLVQHGAQGVRLRMEVDFRELEMWRREADPHAPSPAGTGGVEVRGPAGITLVVSVDQWLAAARRTAMNDSFITETLRMTYRAPRLTRDDVAMPPGDVLQPELPPFELIRVPGMANPRDTAPGWLTRGDEKEK